MNATYLKYLQSAGQSSDLVLQREYNRIFVLLFSGAALGHRYLDKITRVFLTFSDTVGPWKKKMSHFPVDRLAVVLTSRDLCIGLPSFMAHSFPLL